jgi:hypothetical protein
VLEGVADLDVFPSGRGAFVISHPAFEPSDPVVIDIGTADVQRIAVALRPRAGYELIVSVRDPEGAPIANALVEVHGDGPLQFLATDASGLAIVRGVGTPSGLEVSAAGFLGHRHDGQGAALPSRVDIVLRPCAVILVQVRHADGSGYSGRASILAVSGEGPSARGATFRVDRGQALLEQWPPGAYEITVDTGGDLVTRTVTAIAGRQVTVDLAVP